MPATCRRQKGREGPFDAVLLNNNWRAGRNASADDWRWQVIKYGGCRTGGAVDHAYAGNRWRKNVGLGSDENVELAAPKCEGPRIGSAAEAAWNVVFRTAASAVGFADFLHERFACTWVKTVKLGFAGAGEFRTLLSVTAQRAKQ